MTQPARNALWGRLLFVVTLATFGFLSVILSQSAQTQDMRHIEEFKRRMEELTRKMQTCGADPDCLSQAAEEIRKAMKDMPDPTGQMSQVPIGDGRRVVRVPFTMKIVNRTEYKRMDKGPGANWACGKRPPDRVYTLTFWTFEYEAQEEGVLHYLTDFSQFHLQSPSKGPYLADRPGDFRIRQSTGYRQLWERGPGDNCVLKSYPDGALIRIDSGNKTFSFVISRPTSNENPYVYFGPIAILVENADKSCPGCPLSTYDPDRLNSADLSEYQHNPRDFLITTADMQAALKVGRLERTFRYRRQPIDDFGGYKDNRLTVSIEFQANPGILAVTPADGFQSAGPDKTGQFIPSSKAYAVKNIGGSPIRLNVSKTENWLNLSSTGGELAPGQSTTLTVAIAPSARSLPSNTYQGQIQFTNQTNGQGSTARAATLDVSEIQVWEVKLTGQETDDLGGALMYLKTKEAWKHVVVDYGIRFDYTMLARFTLKKQQGGWKYAVGEISGGQVGYSSNFDPNVFSVIKIVCKNCQDVPKLKGSFLNGELQGNAVRLLWPNVVTRVIVTNALKLQYQSKEKSQQGYSDNYFESNEFFQRAHGHLVPVKEGEKRFEVSKTSALEKFTKDKRRQVTISYRYWMKRLQ